MINKVFLIGFLGRDPEARVTPNGLAITKFSLATTEKVKGEKTTDWHNIVTFGKTAEFCGRYLAKGREVFVEGRISYNKWEDKDGNKRITTEIIANSVQALGKPAESPPMPAENTKKEERRPDIPSWESDLPF